MQLGRGHRISVDAHVLREKMCDRFQKGPFEIAVNTLNRTNDQRETCDEADRSLRITVYQSRHMFKLALTKKEYIPAGGQKSLHTAKQVRDLRSRIVRRERSNCHAKKAGRRRICFAQLLPKLLDPRSQQSHVNFRVSCILVGELSRRKPHGFLIESIGRRNRGSLGWEKYSLRETCLHQMR